VRQGEIRQRLDTTVAVPQYVLVVSGPIYNTADTGRVIACRVLPAVPPEDFAGVHPVSYTNLDGISTIGIAVPELLDWYPRAALSAPVGVVTDMRPVMALVHNLFR
jgi:hypothetical protein